MHDRLSELLGVEVVGEVVRIGGALFDVGLGRAALPDLDRDRIDGLLEKLRKSVGTGMQVADRLHLQNADPLVRGVVEVSLRTEGSNSPYLLQLTTPSVLAVYHRRFLLEEGLLGDLAGVVCTGLGKLVAEGEGPLRVLSGFQETQLAVRELVDAAVKASASGRSFDPSSGLAELVPSLRRAWKLIPWPLRSGLSACSRPEQGRVAPHDRVMRRTLLVAVDQHSGSIVYQYVHQPNAWDDYDQVLAWLTDVHQAMLTTYAPPTFACALARASTVEQFMACHPGLKGIVGPPLPRAAG